MPTEQKDKKTAMQMLRDKLQVVVDDLKDAVSGTDQYGYRSAMENVVKDIDAQMMETERKQLAKSFYAGKNSNDLFPGYYYNQYGKR